MLITKRRRQLIRWQCDDPQPDCRCDYCTHPDPCACGEGCEYTAHDGNCCSCLP